MNLTDISILLVNAETMKGTPADAVGLHVSKATEQSSYAVARWIMDLVEWILGIVGLQDNDTVFIWLYAIMVFGLAFVAGVIVKWIVQFILNKIGPHINGDFYKYLVSHKFFTKICRIIPPLVFLILIQFTLNGRQTLSMWLTRLTWIYIVFILCSSISTMADVIWTHVNNRANKRKLPLNGVVQLLKLIIWLIGVIIVVAILCNRSPGSLLAGLGAFSAVLMLVFKDNILGVVAGIQLAEDDSLHVGDWIVPAGSDANGSVVEVGLTAIKIENWDKTISTLPPYSLVSKGFRNYRNMQQSHTRRIQRSYMIDADSVVPVDDAMLEEFSRIPLISGWIAKKTEQRNAGKVADVNNPEGLADGSLDSNLGIFRAYVKMYLDNNPGISHDDTCFVCTLAQTAAGIPLQIYCFTSTSSWLPYESIQSTVFEHLAVMLYRFHLYTFENPSGRDTIADGYLSPGKDPEYIFGLPYPFFCGSGTPTRPGTPPAGLYPNASPYCGQVQQTQSAPESPLNPSGAAPNPPAEDSPS